MTAPEGGFYSALDAETNGEEGAYYVWTRDEVKPCSARAPTTSLRPGLRPDGRAEFERADTSCEPRTRAEQAEALKTTTRGAGGTPAAAPRPAAGGTRKAPRAALRRQGLDRLERPDDRRLCRRLPRAQGRAISPGRREGRRVPPGDAAHPRRPPAADLPPGPGQAARLPGRLRLPRPRPAPASRRHRRPRWLREARAPDRPDDRRFRGREEGGFFFTADDHESLLARAKDPFDSALPSGNSVAILNLVALHRAPASRPISTTRARRSTPSAQRWPSSRPQCRLAWSAWSNTSTRNPARPRPSRWRPEHPAMHRPGGGGLGATARRDSGRDRSRPRVRGRDPSRSRMAGTSTPIPPESRAEADDPRSRPPSAKIATLVKVSYPAGEAKVLGSLGTEKVSLYEKTSDPGSPAARARTKPGLGRAKAQTELSSLQRPPLPGAGEAGDSV